MSNTLFVVVECDEGGVIKPAFKAGTHAECADWLNRTHKAYPILHLDDAENSFTNADGRLVWTILDLIGIAEPAL